MIDAICREIELRTDYLEGRRIKTIYFGGGTPSLLTKDELTQILNTISGRFAIDNDVEISLEANPDDITVDNLEIWRDVKINRLSIGIQSFKQSDLDWMNRAHNVNEAENCIELAQEFGFNNLTIDLIYGLPNLTNSEWIDHIQKVISLDVNHISAYCLTVEKKTTLDHLVKTGKIIPPSDEQQSEQFLVLVDLLEENGLNQYEISNFAKNGFESQHNSNYWKGEWYLGVGPSAHSFNGISRSWCVSNNQKYIKSLQESELALETEILTANDRFNESLMTGLRTSYGVNKELLKSILPLSESFVEQIELFKTKNWLIENEECFYLSQQGRLRADFIASELFVV